MYFPFAKNVKFKTRKDILVSKLPNGKDWVAAIAQKKVVIVNNGNYLENIITLSFLEAIKYVFPSIQIEIICNEEYQKLYYYQGISKPSNFEIDNKTLLNYPAPIFFNNTNDTVYFNTLFNCDLVFDIYGNYVKRNKRPIYHQIIPNLMIDWNEQYLPKFRLDFKDYKYNFNNYILILPDRLPWAKSRTDNFTWTNQDMKTFTSLMSSIGIRSVILSPRVYYGITNKDVMCAECSLDALLYYSLGASYVLSKENEYLLSIPFINQKCNLITNTRRSIYSLTYNFSKYEFQNKIIDIEEITPISVYDRIKYGRSDNNGNDNL
jgi:hypothetical protein